MSGCKKLKKSFQMLANSLRLMFPERFNPARMEDGGGVVVGGAVPKLAILVSSGDYLYLNWNQCMRDGGTIASEESNHSHPCCNSAACSARPSSP